MINRAILLAAATWMVFLATPVLAENWPQWRGPKFDGVSGEKSLPTKWSKSEGIAWRVELPGPAGATPCAWGDRLFMTAAVGDKVEVLSVSTAGKLLWRKSLGSGSQDVRGDEGNFASNSPVTDGKHVWAMMANGPLACYDFQGKEVWRVDLAERYGKFDIAFGLSSTPVLDGEHLFVQLFHTKSKLIVCLDKQSGSEIWKHERESDARGEPLHAYASPVLYRDDQQAFLVVHGADYASAHRLNDGGEIWRLGGFNPPPGGAYRQDFRFVSSPLVVPGLIVVPSCKNGKTTAIAPDGKGNITDGPKQLWTYPETPDVPSPLYDNGLVYLCRESGILICLDAKTGEKIYAERTFDGRHRGSPILAGGNIYLTVRDGVVSVIKAGRKFEKVSENDIGEPIAASPVPFNGRIYLRTFKSLMAVGAK